MTARHETEPGIFSQADNVVELASEEALERAWEEYRLHTARAHVDLSLYLDRGYIQDNIRLHNRFQRLFKMREGL